jgi:hypothetical protein
MFDISTSDYVISRGDRSSSPCATDEEIITFRKNQINKRRIIEEELQKISENERNNLTILMKCLHSDYVEQIIEVKIVKEEEKRDVLNIINNNTSSLFKEYSPYCDASVYPEIWNKFDYEPFNKFNNIQNDKLQKPLERVYLFVPYDYKNDAKALGAKFDWETKKWFVYTNHKNKQKLIDTYHLGNFIDKTINKNLITNEEWIQEIESEILIEEEKTELHKKWIEIHGNDDKFDDWYFSEC